MERADRAVLCRAFAAASSGTPRSRCSAGTSFSSRLQSSLAQRHQLQLNEKVQADPFEAHVAALHQEHGSEKARDFVEAVFVPLAEAEYTRIKVPSFVSYPFDLEADALNRLRLSTVAPPTKVRDSPSTTIRRRRSCALFLSLRLYVLTELPLADPYWHILRKLIGREDRTLVRPRPPLLVGIRLRPRRELRRQNQGVDGSASRAALQLFR